jgi:hypothetical protein
MDQYKNKNILILASKPNPDVPLENDMVVFVNGSVCYFNEFTCKRDHVFGDSIFFWDSEIAKMNKSFLENKKIDKAWIIQFRNVELEKSLKEVNYTYKEAELITYAAKEKMTMDKLYSSILRELIKCKYFLFKEKTKFFYQEVYKRKRIKLSTGAFAFLLMKMRYPEANICIAGIGFGLDSYEWFKGTNAKRGHFINDYVGFLAMKSLGLLHNVTTTEIDLNKLFNIPMTILPTRKLSVVKASDEPSV